MQETPANWRIGRAWSGHVPLRGARWWSCGREPERPRNSAEHLGRAPGAEGLVDPPVEHRDLCAGVDALAVGVREREGRAGEEAEQDLALGLGALLALYTTRLTKPG